MICPENAILFSENHVVHQPTDSFESILIFEG